MRLLRVGDIGREKVAALDNNNIMRDLSSHIKDLNPQTINFDNLKKLEQIKLEAPSCSAIFFTAAPLLAL